MMKSSKFTHSKHCKIPFSDRVAYLTISNQQRIVYTKPPGQVIPKFDKSQYLCY